ncbi:unnamed protein product [Rotaria sordida]|uniref:Uncharacterized protein n=1 Tax=Rotaria sordida TaxID=392033 RepID=A0A819GW15_9BILA|nr:unnamed protein product [Rotaria sordida]
MNTKFNQAEYQLNSLIPMLLERTHMMCLHIDKNEKLNSPLITLLTQGNYQGHTISLKPHSFYQLEQIENYLIPFDQFELLPTIQNRLREELISTTMTWLSWMPYLRSVNVDTQMLSKLVPTINLNGTINRFSSLQELIVRQLDDIPLNEDTLTVIVRLGVSSSLRNIHIKQYKVLNSQSIDDNNFLANVCQICCNMHKLETMTIEFANPHSLFDSTILEELAGIEKKNCQFECIYVSDNIIQFWLEK